MRRRQDCVGTAWSVGTAGMPNKVHRMHGCGAERVKSSKERAYGRGLDSLAGECARETCRTGLSHSRGNHDLYK